MFRKFKNVTKSDVGATLTTIYEVPNNTVTNLTGLNVANVADVAVTVDILVGGVHLIKNAALPVGTALSLIEESLNLGEGNLIQVVASTESAVDVILAITEEGS